MGTVESEGRAVLKEKIGFCFMALGTSTAGSEKIYVPLILMGIGLWFVRRLVEW